MTDEPDYDALRESEPTEVLNELFDLATEWAEGLIPELRADLDPDIGRDENGEWAVDHWTLIIYEAVSEMVGGEADGAEVYSGWSANITPLLAKLGPLEGMEMAGPEVVFSCTVGMAGYFGIPHVCVSGTFQGYSVSVMFLARPPAEAKPSWRINQQNHMIPIEDEDEDEEYDDEEEYDEDYDYDDEDDEDDEI